MTSERRYGDGEVRRILEAATRADAAAPHTGATAEGMTLAEIQAIAGEVGVSPAAVQRAAASLDLAARSGVGTSWGLPVQVGRVVPLPRALSEEEWGRLVAELRSTFGARGRVQTQGALREWWNGNLHAAMEPTEHGYRLRLGTRKSDAEPIAALGAVGIAAGALVAGVTALAGAPELGASLILALGGAATLVANLVRLPRWARRRQRQMEEVEAKVGRMLAAEGARDGEG